jgi:hypothetical protein
MKKFLAIIFVLAALVGCDQEDILLSERDLIENYLTETRRMVVEEELGNVIQENPPFYNVFGRYAYRHIVNYYDADRENRPVVDKGDKIEIRFNAYILKVPTSSKKVQEPSKEDIYWSNNPDIIEALGNKVIGNGTINTLDWPTELLTIKLGESKILEGLERTLPGCREADSVQVYMTSNQAYGKQLIGVVPKNSMVAWYMKIEKVTK